MVNLFAKFRETKVKPERKRTQKKVYYKKDFLLEPLTEKEELVLQKTLLPKNGLGYAEAMRELGEPIKYSGHPLVFIGELAMRAVYHNILKNDK